MVCCKIYKCYCRICNKPYYGNKILTKKSAETIAKFSTESASEKKNQKNSKTKFLRKFSV